MAHTELARRERVCRAVRYTNNPCGTTCSAQHNAADNPCHGYRGASRGRRSKTARYKRAKRHNTHSAGRGGGKKEECSWELRDTTHRQPVVVQEQEFEGGQGGEVRLLQAVESVAVQTQLLQRDEAAEGGGGHAGDFIVVKVEKLQMHQGVECLGPNLEGGGSR